jgi:uncharacterized protein
LLKKYLMSGKSNSAATTAQRLGPTVELQSANPTDGPLGHAATKRVLLMMAKHWTPGLVKTRLAAAIGQGAAAELHRVFVYQLAKSLNACGDQRQILLAPADRCDAVAELANCWSVLPQGAGDLGQRMWRAFETELTAAGSPASVVMIGADLPTLTQADVDRAFAALGSSDLVLGPARDGGYYLIALRGRIADPSSLSDRRFARLF